MVANRIALDAETARHHSAKLKAAHEAVMAGSEVRAGVQGNQGQPAEKVFHGWLTTSAGSLGDAADTLRRVVGQNAEALLRAAEDLLARDADSADAAKTVLAMLDGSEQTAPTGTGLSASGAASGAGATRTEWV
jgi:hypothetical protein